MTWLIEEETGGESQHDDADSMVLWEGDDALLGKVLFNIVRSLHGVGRISFLDSEVSARSDRLPVMTVAVRESFSDGPEPVHHIQVSDEDGDVMVYVLPPTCRVPVGEQLIVGCQDLNTGHLHLFSRSLTEMFVAVLLQDLAELIARLQGLHPGGADIGFVCVEGRAQRSSHRSQLCYKRIHGADWLHRQGDRHMTRRKADPGTMKPSQYAHFVHKGRTLKMKTEELARGMEAEGATIDVVKALDAALAAVVHAQSVIDQAKQAREVETASERDQRRVQREVDGQKRRAEAEARKAAKASAKQAQDLSNAPKKRLEDVLVPSAVSDVPIHQQSS
jgi:hypothetical protein